MKITRLKLNSFNKKISIFLDGDFAISVNGQVVLEKALKIGQDLNEKDLKNLLLQSLKVEFYTLCLDKISIRPRSIQEIRIYLIKVLKNKKFTSKAQFAIKAIDEVISNQDDLINQIIDKLIQNKYLDDYKFAQYFVRTKSNLARKGQQIIRIELFKKGVDDKIIKKVISDKTLFSEEKVEENIDYLIENNYKKIAYKNYPKQKLKQVLLRRLVSRGYTFDQVLNKIDEFVRNK